MRGKDKNCLFRRISLFSTILKVIDTIPPWAGDNKHFFSERRNKSLVVM